MAKVFLFRLRNAHERHRLCGRDEVKCLIEEQTECDVINNCSLRTASVWQLFSKRV